MSRVFVHGNPETAAIWDPLVAALAERGETDIVRLSPPGFGAPAADGWTATPANYVTWLADELEPLAAAGPVDLIGHDWGAGHVFGLAAERPDLIRSVGADCGGLLNADYVWHDAAQGWRTPEVGEEMIAGMVGASTDDKRALFAGLGLPDDMAASLAEAANETMGRCILELYRGADPEVMQDLAGRLAEADRRPTLIIDATGDPYVSTDLVPPVAETLEAEVLRLEGNGHWWMVEDPATAADGLIAFWDRVEGQASTDVGGSA